MFFELRDKMGNEYHSVQIHNGRSPERFKSLSEIFKHIESNNLIYVTGQCIDQDGNLNVLEMSEVNISDLTSISEYYQNEARLEIEDIMTLTEAAAKWRLADGATIRKAIERGKFDELDVKRSGRTWLISYQAMERVFGKIKEDAEDMYVPYNRLIYMLMNVGASLYFMKDMKGRMSEDTLNEVPHLVELRQLFIDMQHTADAGSQIIITNSEDPNSHIRNVIGSPEELKQYYKHLQNCRFIHPDLVELYGVKL